MIPSLNGQPGPSFARKLFLTRRPAPDGLYWIISSFSHRLMFPSKEKRHIPDNMAATVNIWSLDFNFTLSRSALDTCKNRSLLVLFTSKTKHTRESNGNSTIILPSWVIHMFSSTAPNWARVSSAAAILAAGGTSMKSNLARFSACEDEVSIPDSIAVKERDKP